MLIENNSLIYVRFDVFTAVTIKNIAFCDIDTQFVLRGDTLLIATEPSQLMRCKG
jgi:hypothetical protein